jgi:hypothetical protein
MSQNKSTKKKRPQLPKKIFVTWDGSTGEQYLDARKTICGFDEGARIGVYELLDTKTMKITESLE